MTHNINESVLLQATNRGGLSRRRMVLLTTGLAGAAWAGLVALIFLFNTGQYDFWFPGRLLVYVLLLVAPALTFMPIGHALNFRLYGYWAVLSWAVFGYTLAFVPSDPTLGWNGNSGPLAVLLGSLFMVSVTITLPIFYRLGFRLFSRKVEQYDLSRAQREAVLVGIWILLSAFLRVAGALNLLSALALLLVFVVLELLILSRNIGRR